MSEQKIENNENLVSIIDGEPYLHKSEWEKISYEKTSEIFKILSGLNVWQAKKIIEGLGYTIEKNSIIS
jgi:hypothetical protein